MNRYEEAKAMYAKIGVDTDAAINTLKKYSSVIALLAG